MMLIRHRAGSLRSRRGSVAVEYAFILPVLLLFVLGIMDTGRLIWTYATLNRAAEAAARCASVDTATCGTVAQINNGELRHNLPLFFCVPPERRELLTVSGVSVQARLAPYLLLKSRSASGR